MTILAFNSIAHPIGALSSQARHSKHACSEAQRVIWNPASSQPVERVAAKAGFQISHFAALRFAFGMTGV